MYHVLEHTEDPFSILLKLKKLLKPTGILVIEVPNIEATCQAPINRFHQAHLYNFNKETLSMIGIKAGYNILDANIAKDGGNILMLFRNSRAAEKSVSGKIEGNYEHISQVIQRHTNFIHYTSVYPYSRLFRKIVRIITEKNVVRGFSHGKEILDCYYKQWILNLGSSSNSK